MTLGRNSQIREEVKDDAIIQTFIIISIPLKTQVKRNADNLAEIINLKSYIITIFSFYEYLGISFPISVLTLIIKFYFILIIFP